MKTQAVNLSFNKVGFNAAVAATQTEEEFMAQWAPIAFLNLKLTDREVLLKEAYLLCCKKMEVEPRGFTHPADTAGETAAKLPIIPPVEDEKQNTGEEPAEDPAEDKPAGKHERRGR